MCAYINNFGELITFIQYMYQGGDLKINYML